MMCGLEVCSSSDVWQEVVNGSGRKWRHSGGGRQCLWGDDESLPRISDRYHPHPSLAPPLDSLSLGVLSAKYPKGLPISSPPTSLPPSPHRSRESIAPCVSDSTHLKIL